MILDYNHSKGGVDEIVKNVPDIRATKRNIFDQWQYVLDVWI